METRVRIRKEAEIRAEREKAEVYHKIDVDQVKAET
jgi:hypothetical protein